MLSRTCLRIFGHYFPVSVVLCSSCCIYAVDKILSFLLLHLSYGWDVVLIGHIFAVDGVRKLKARSVQ